MGYQRNFDVILLVGYTELKAQVSWIDSATVCAHASRVSRTHFSHHPDFHVRKSRGQKKGW